MVCCAAVACKNNSSFKTSNRAESKLLSPSLRFKVKKNVVSQYKRLYPKEGNIRVCHLHFEETCFQRDCILFL